MSSFRTLITGSIAVAGAVALWLTGTPSAQAATSASGTVQCLSGDSVTGVWIQASSGSGFASWTPESGLPSKARFSKSGISGSWTVHVGCGGKRESWKYTPKGNRTVTSNVAHWSCYTPNMGRSVNFCQLA